MVFQEALALGDTPVPIVKVHPTVVFSILNSYVRREKRDFRVIGTLLGVVKDGQIEVIAISRRRVLYAVALCSRQLYRRICVRFM